MRHGDMDPCPGRTDTVDFSNGSNHVCQVFKDIIGMHLRKLTVGKRPWQLIQIMNDFGVCMRAEINVDCAIDLSVP